MEKPTPTCKNGQKMIWGATTFEYEENDILVEVSNVPAWICPDCDDVSFPPGVSQQLITSVRELITATRRSRARNIPLYEYHVKVAMEELERIPNFKNDEEIIAFMEEHSGFELVDQGLAEIVETPTLQKKIQIELDSAILNQLKSSNEPLFITRKGRTEAVILSVEQYVAMMDLLKNLKNEPDPELGQMIAEARSAYKTGEGSDFANLLTAGKIGQEQTMTPLTLDPKYVDIFQVFGNLDEIVEKALHRYAIEQINERIEKSRQEVLSFEAKYGMTYQEFLERVTTDEAFVDNLENNYLTWEMDWQTWEYYTEVLDEWLGRLEKLSTI